MPKFPADAPKARVLRALGFQVIREKEHISMRRKNPDGTMTPLTLPNHRILKAPTLRAICRQSNIDRNDFINAYRKA